MLDVLLVGRTKMLRLHSCVWLENNTGVRLEPCLSLGSHCMTPVVLGPGDKLDSLQRLHLRVSAAGWLIYAVSTVPACTVHGPHLSLCFAVGPLTICKVLSFWCACLSQSAGLDVNHARAGQ